jgi:hypothetical protein
MIEYKKVTAFILAGYVAGMTAARANPAGFAPESVDRLTAFGTAGAFLALALMLIMRDTDAEFPNMIPFTLVMTATYALLTLFQGFIGPGGTRFSNTVGIASFVAAALTVIFTKKNGLDIGLVVLLGLPLAVPGILAVLGIVMANTARGLVPDDLIGNAFRTSQLVYARTKNDDFEEVEFVKNVETGARAGIYVSKSQGNRDIYLAFAGTESKTGWIKTDFRATNAKYPYATDAGEVHRGFLDAWNSIREETWDRVSNVILRNAGTGRIIVCGHSLGGALSTVASGDLLNRIESQFLDKFHVVTFGSPVVGTQDFVTWYDMAVPRSVRVASVFDPVPKTPISNFVHVKTLRQVHSLTGTPINAHSMSEYGKTLLDSRSDAVVSFMIPASVLGGILWYLYVSK